MPSVTEAHVERVCALVSAIPPGHVVTCGDITDAAGLSSARIVGRLIAPTPATYRGTE